ncbi:hypothetical protein V8F33_005981 [Rhypophila sp. PSN 637]
MISWFQRDDSSDLTFTVGPGSLPLVHQPASALEVPSVGPIVRQSAPALEVPSVDQDETYAVGQATEQPQAIVHLTYVIHGAFAVDYHYFRNNTLERLAQKGLRPILFEFHHKKKWDTIQADKANDPDHRTLLHKGHNLLTQLMGWKHAQLVVLHAPSAGDVTGSCWSWGLNGWESTDSWQYSKTSSYKCVGATRYGNADISNVATTGFANKSYNYLSNSCRTAMFDLYEGIVDPQHRLDEGRESGNVLFNPDDMYASFCDQGTFTWNRVPN